MLLLLPLGALQWPRRAAIVGAGTMGLGVAEAWLAAGVALTLNDATPESTQQAHQRLIDRVRGHIDAGLADAALLGRAEATLAQVAIADAVADADLVLEAVFDPHDVKAPVLHAIEAATTPDTIIASNTSSLPIDTLAALLSHPARLLGMHWFNPPEWTPGVELIPSRHTDPAHIARCATFLQAIGKRPVVVGSGPGFVANRIQVAMLREAMACVADGLATPAEVDEVVRACFGFRLPFFGPFQIADMAGLDVYAAVFATLERGLGERFATPELLRDMVAQGRYGTKGGQGFYSYSDAERDALLIERDKRYAALAELLAVLSR
jgi:3-hydroxybutyryl-CoA dehydrogenase